MNRLVLCRCLLLAATTSLVDIGWARTPSPSNHGAKLDAERASHISVNCPSAYTAATWSLSKEQRRCEFLNAIYGKKRWARKRHFWSMTEKVKGTILTASWESRLFSAGKLHLTSKQSRFSWELAPVASTHG